MLLLRPLLSKENESKSFNPVPPLQLTFKEVTKEIINMCHHMAMGGILRAALFLI